MNTKMHLLQFAQKTISTFHLPGRYVLSDLISKSLIPEDGMVDGKIGAYSVRFNLKDMIQRQIYFHLYDMDEIKLLQACLKEGHVFLDVGANIGYYSLIASQVVKGTGKVFAFEPIPDNAKVLDGIIRQNDVANIVLCQKAVGNKKGVLTLYVGDGDEGDSGWASLVESNRRRRSVEVEMIAIDDFLEANGIDRVDFIKLDVEGAEYEVLQGSKKLLSRKDAPDLICEINPFLLNKRGLSSTTLTKELSNYGYQLFKIGRNNEKVAPENVIEVLTNLYCTKKLH